MKIKKLLSFVLVFVFILATVGCQTTNTEEKVQDTSAEEAKNAVDEALIKEKEHIEEIIAEEAPEDAVEKIMAEMTLEEKVYQMMFVAPESITKVGQVTVAGEATKEALQKYPVGGIIYFGQNMESPEQTKEMIANTQSYSKIPLFISVDEEGGRVSRVGGNPAMGTTKHPVMMEIGDTKDPQKAYDVGATIAKELSPLGFNVDFAPDADVLISEKNIEITDRSFGYDAQNVALMVESKVKGLQENGMSATLKHFPGAGSTEQDSHIEPTSSARTIEQFRNEEFKPFEAGIAAGADFVMMSHMILTTATKEQLPSSLSKEVVTGMLKEELGFEGIVITDSFAMGAITEKYTTYVIGVMAVEAGVDMILMSQDFEATHKGIIDAVAGGKISEERIDESVRKILNLKFKKGLWK